jgi:small subunit ribosomal protein S7
MLVLDLVIGKLIKKGQKAKAEKVLFDCLKTLEKKGEKEPLKAFLEGIEQIIPLVEIKSKKVGGTVYRIPIEINQKRQLSLGIGWLLESVKSKSQERGSLAERLATEILLAKQGQGKTVERVRELHVFAQKNRGLVKFL